MSPSVAIPIIACVAALLLTPVTSRLALRKGWVDKPGVRKVHNIPVAYLGGAAVMGALLIGLSALLWLPGLDGALLESFDLRLAAIVAGCAMMFVVGLIDDIHDIRASRKLIAQLIAAGLVVCSGVIIDGFPLTETYRIEFGIFGILVTIFWIVGVTNAINIIDGLDGLASGISLVACGAISWTAFHQGNPAAGLLMLTLMGAILGFLPYNIHPAKVFLGDAGSLTIGFALASTAALTATKASTAVGLLVPLVALGIPILDTLFAMIRRTIERRSMLSADKSHLHHRLMALGFGQPKTVLLLCTIAALGVIATITTTPGGNLPRLGLAVAALLAYTVVFRLTGAIRFRESLAAVSGLAQNARLASDERQVVDASSLELASACNIEEWWGSVTRAAHGLSFDAIEIDAPLLFGTQPKRRSLSPSTLKQRGRLDTVPPGLNPLAFGEKGNAMDATLAFTLASPSMPGRFGSLTLRISHSTSLECAARRYRLFCRIIESSDISRFRVVSAIKVGARERARHTASA